MKILVSGFTTWGKVEHNPSEDLSRAMGGVVLPVEYHTSWRDLKNSVSEERPDLILMLGLSPKAHRIEIEIRAHNKKIDGGMIDYRGPGQLETIIPRHILRECTMDDVGLSYNAGDFVCNYIYYKAMQNLDIQSLFVHVPSLEYMSFDVQMDRILMIQSRLTQD